MVTIRLSWLVVCLAASSACWGLTANMLPIQTPQLIVDDLVATDRRFAADAAGTTLIPALTAMFADDVVMQAPGGMVYGAEDATAALRNNPVNAAARITWTPIRGGISSDGTHGFTFGYMTMTPADGEAIPLKYVAYWIRRNGQWKVAAYKRRGRPAGDVSLSMLASSLPERLDFSPDMSRLIEHQRSLVAAEKAFSDEAQTIGIGPAFEKHGWPDAMNVGGPADAAFVIGNVEIGRSVGAGSAPGTSPVYWSADEALVSPSGDLGITFGRITPHPVQGAPAAQPVPFFTIWRRIGGVWKYIAE